MQHQLLAALHLSALDTLESLLSHLYGFYLQKKVAQPVLQTHLQLEKVVVNPKAMCYPTSRLPEDPVCNGNELFFFHCKEEGKQVRWCLEKEVQPHVILS